MTARKRLRSALFASVWAHASLTILWVTVFCLMAHVRDALGAALMALCIVMDVLRLVEAVKLFRAVGRDAA